MRNESEFQVDEMPTHANPPIQDVLVPTDGSDVTLAAFETVAPLFACCRATIHTLHVREGGAVTRDRLRYDPEIAAEETLDSFTDTLEQRGFETRSHLAHGVPSEEIVRVASETDADMIVMVTQRTNSVLNKSITQSVLASVDRPVLTMVA